jgi:GNAT superfamily N-acetyltransferase
MNTSPNVRRAEPSDLPYLVQFEQMVIDAERPYDPTLRPSSIQYYDLEGMLADKESVLIAVMEEADEILATGYARIEAAKPRYLFDHYAYLGFMCVRPDYRGQGLIQQLIAYLSDWVAAKGINEMRLEVYSGNIAAIRAYEKLGFQPYMLQMRLTIP